MPNRSTARMVSLNAQSSWYTQTFTPRMIHHAWNSWYVRVIHTLLLWYLWWKRNCGLNDEWMIDTIEYVLWGFFTWDGLGARVFHFHGTLDCVPQTDIVSSAWPSRLCSEIYYKANVRKNKTGPHICSEVCIAPTFMANTWYVNYSYQSRLCDVESCGFISLVAQIFESQFRSGFVHILLAAFCVCCTFTTYAVLHNVHAWIYCRCMCWCIC